jgi:hypothetical protein
MLVRVVDPMDRNHRLMGRLKRIRYIRSLDYDALIFPKIFFA